jgi:signal transduction histidine kinase
MGNLLNNAIKYSRPGGRIRVALEARAETVVLEVGDEGIGIEAGEIRHLFEPFFRGSNALQAQIRGAGIGLSLVKSIADAHRGTISVKSKIKEGSVFTLALPAVPVPSVPEKHEVT